MKKLLLTLLIAINCFSCSKPNVTEVTTSTELPISVINKLSDSTIVYNYAIINTDKKMYLIQNKKVVNIINKENDYDKTLRKKIIATTDSKLTEKIDMIGTYVFNLPQSSDDFLQLYVYEYNTENKIEKVNIEYKTTCCGFLSSPEYIIQHAMDDKYVGELTLGKELHDNCAWDCNPILTLKTTPDNTISIKKI